MTTIEIENNLNNLIANFDENSFVFDLLLAYGTPKSTIKRLQGSDHDRLATHRELVVRKKLFFKIAHENLHSTIDSLKTQKEVTKYSPRFIIVTDFQTLLAYDTKTDDTLDIEVLNIANHYDFFLPLAGMEKATYIDENPADVKASLKMAKLYDELQKNNHFETKEDIHALNVFLTRLLFCYFAEDTNIFPDNAVTNSISSHTALNGSDVDSFLSRLFKIFNTPTNKREPNTPAYLNAFPYVNGGLFRDEYPIPQFTTKSRNILIEIGQLNWSQINPDIFGSMIQAVITPEHRGGMGMHYTSVPNIMKVIEPLFLDELYLEFEKAYNSAIKLQELLNRISRIKIFDPACGSGNFLIIAYKKLRELEISILQRINSIATQKHDTLFGQKKTQLSFLSLSSKIELSQFYGIELDDFAHEVALLSLWLAEHQMNREFDLKFSVSTPSLPLQNGGNIVHGNATRVNWEEVCPKNDGDEIYILGNPPYLGSSKQSKEQKDDMNFLFKNFKNYKTLDYIASWFYKGANYIRNINAKCSFVSTNSIAQGEQVSILWPNILKNDLEIGSAYQSFKWQNNAKDNAKVIVVIIEIRNICNKPKYIISNRIRKEVKNISYYLADTDNIIVKDKNRSFINNQVFERCGYIDKSDNLFFNENEYLELINQDYEIKLFVRPLIGGQEMLKGINKYALWIPDNMYEKAISHTIIKKRIELTKTLRNNNKPPHQFNKMKESKNNILVAPRVSSKNRDYLPIKFFDRNTAINDSVIAIFDPEEFIFGIVSSKMHMVWIRTVAGRLKEDYRYSSNLCYNTFPFPNISQKQKDEITELVFAILDEREKHSQKTLAQLYDPDKMPEGLRKAHHNLDIAIEQCYRAKPFESDEERLEYLFKMYEEMKREEIKK